MLAGHWEMHVKRWFLFVDESGRFSSEDEPACVGGILVEGDAAGEIRAEVLEEKLRRMLECAVPIAMRPFHATDARTWTYWVAGWQLAGAEARAAQYAVNPMHTPALERLAEHVMAGAPSAGPATLRLRRQLAGGRIPSRGELMAAAEELEIELESAGRGHLVDDARNMVRNAFMRLRDAVEAVASAAVDLGVGCHLVAAWDDPSMVGADDAAGRAPEGAGRYQGALTALFEAVYATLRTDPPSDHVVFAHIEQLNVFDQRSERWLPLQEAHVLECSLRAARVPLHAPLRSRDRQVEVVPAVHPHATAPAGCLFADILTNCTRRELRSAHETRWHGLVGMLHHQTGLRPSAVVRADPAAAPAPLIATMGRARALFHLALSPLRAENAPRASASAREVWPLWSREATENWCQIARRIP